MKQVIVVLCFIFCGCIYVNAQDIHYTQYYAGPININPAYASFYKGTQRYTLQNKTQWRSVTVPFNTLSASFDMPIKKRNIKRDLFGGGISVNNDQAGDSKFGTTQMNFSFSYIRAFKNYQYISVGVQPGIAQRKIDYTALYFDNQWDGYSYNPALSNNEQFSKEKFFFFDFSFGLLWAKIKDKNNAIEAGMALSHLNKPKQSLFNNKDIRLDQKFLAHFNLKKEIKENLVICPGVLFMRQGTYNEIDLGSLIRYVQEPQEINYLSLFGGIYYRMADAFNLIAGVEYKNATVGISYDINASNLFPASRARGGLEISIIYIADKSVKTYNKKVPCPIL